MNGAPLLAVGHPGKTADFSTSRLWRSGRNDAPVGVVPRFGGHDDILVLGVFCSHPSGAWMGHPRLISGLHSLTADPSLCFG